MTKDQNPPLVIGIGEVLWDFLPRGRQMGGAPANFAYHTGVLGARAQVLSAVGDDLLGREILELLAAAAVGQRMIATDLQHPTGTVTVELDADGQPEYVIREDVAWDHIPLTEEMREIAAEADAVCFGSLALRSKISRKNILAFVEATPRECLRVCDLNLRAPFYDAETADTALTHANTLKINEDELATLRPLLDLDEDEPKAAAELMERYELDLVALTRGEKGAELITSEEHVKIPAIPPGNMVSAVGAGDSFTAALVMGLLRKRPLEDIGEHAARLASYVCEQPGAMPAVPSELKS